MGKNIVIIGGGIVGLSSAYYLQKEGHQVTVIDKSDISCGRFFRQRRVHHPKPYHSLGIARNDCQGT